MIEKNISPQKQVRNLLLVIGSAVGLAIALALFSLHYYSPTGSYLAKNVLLSPENVKNMSFSEQNPKTGKMTHYTFDEIEFSFFDTAKKSWRKQSVHLQQYEDFYQTVAHLRSLSSVGPEIKDLFSTGHPSILSIKMKNEGSDASKPFIDVHFSEDYFRVELREQSPTENWAYYFSPNIYQKALLLFSHSL